MADIEFNCPNCSNTLVVDETGAGMQVECPECNATIIIPSRPKDTEPLDSGVHKLKPDNQHKQLYLPPPKHPVVKPGRKVICNQRLQFPSLGEQQEQESTGDNKPDEGSELGREGEEIKSPNGFHFPLLMEPDKRQEPSSSSRTCPFCAEEINIKAIKCKHCGSMLDGSDDPKTRQSIKHDREAPTHAAILPQKAARKSDGFDWLDVVKLFFAACGVFILLGVLVHVLIWFKDRPNVQHQGEASSMTQQQPPSLPAQAASPPVQPTSPTVPAETLSQGQTEQAQTLTMDFDVVLNYAPSGDAPRWSIIYELYVNGIKVREMTATGISGSFKSVSVKKGDRVWGRALWKNGYGAVARTDEGFANAYTVSGNETPNSYHWLIVVP